MPRGLGDVLDDIDRAIERLAQHEKDRLAGRRVIGESVETLACISRLTREALFRLNRAVAHTPPVL